MFCTVETKRKPLNSLKFRGFHLFAVILRGATGNRTRDTRIFSPLLYQLSYGTIVMSAQPWLSECKDKHIFYFCKLFRKNISIFFYLWRLMCCVSVINILKNFIDIYSAYSSYSSYSSYISSQGISADSGRGDGLSIVGFLRLIVMVFLGGIL